MSDQRCPRCGAARRRGDQWCGLCYADFREAPPAVVGDGAHPASPAPGGPQAAMAPAAALPPMIRPPDQPGAVPGASVAPAAPDQPRPTIPTQATTPTSAPAATPFVPSTNPLAPAAPTATVPTQLPEGVAPVAPVDPAASAGVAAATTASQVPASTAEGDTADPAADLKWPCSRCGESVPMSEDNCTACGQGFLAGAAGLGTTKKAPLIGDVTNMGASQKLMLGLAVAVVVTLGMLAVLFIGGSIFT